MDKLNDLNSKEWLNFTKSWFNNKSAESVIEEFIRFFTNKGDVVFDPFLKNGNTLIASYNTKRNGIGVELEKKSADTVKEKVKQLESQLRLSAEGCKHECKQLVIQNDSYDFEYFWQQYSLPKIDLVITMPNNKTDLINVFVDIKNKVRDGGYVVVILKNEDTSAWDFAIKMKEHYLFKGERVWCLENKPLSTRGYGYNYISNVHHLYCLIFKKIESN
jgi:hypothetical protein